MRKMLKQNSFGRQNSALENLETRLDSAHLHFGSVKTAA